MATHVSCELPDDSDSNMSLGFRVPTAISISSGCSLRATDVLRTHRVERVLVVTDQGVRSTSGFGRFLERLEGHAVDVIVDDGVESNPRVETAQRLGERARAEEFDGVVGIGGGSVLDAAKAGAMLATNPGPV